LPTGGENDDGEARLVPATGQGFLMRTEICKEHPILAVPRQQTLSTSSSLSVTQTLTPIIPFGERRTVAGGADRVRRGG
jgi:hypothetical protein